MWQWWAYWLVETCVKVRLRDFLVRGIVIKFAALWWRSISSLLGSHQSHDVTTAMR
jgi:hypothetical protein